MLAQSQAWDFAHDAIAPTATLLGILIGGVIGWLVGRGRERRDMRRAVYVEWLRAARSLATRPDDSPPTSGEHTVPLPGAKRRINEATVELEIVASKRVAIAANAYLARVLSTDARDAIQSAKSFDDASDILQAYVEPERKTVVTEMRRDLGTRK